MNIKLSQISMKRIIVPCVYPSMTKLTSFLIVSVLLIFAFVPRSLPAQATLPSTAAGAQLSAWLTAFDSHDRATLLAYLQKNAPDRVAHIDDELDFGRRTGGFDLRKVQDCDDTTCAALVQERNSDQFARANIEVDPAPPHLIKKLDIRAIPRPAEFPLPPFTEAAALDALRSRLDKGSTDGTFSGAAIVAKDGKPCFTGAYGLADREKKIPNTLDTKFRIGSMNKMITATAIVQLAQAGKLKVSDPLIKFLPDYPNQAWASKVTIHQLLTTNTASNSKRFRITSIFTVSANRRSNPARVGITPTTASSCSGSSSRRRAGRTTTSTCENIFSNRQA
jgi:D-alanyl-D-alanine carboxypeptidase